jgi:heptosyltransferase-2
MIVKTDCRFFRGNVPCLPHKEKGVHCETCQDYDPIEKKILIIKLGAIGDVLRTTPLLRRLKQEFPRAEISWLTYHPEVVPSEVDRIYSFRLQDILPLLVTSFDIVYNLDKDLEACSLLNLLKAEVKKGFCLKDGQCSPIDQGAYPKWVTGLFDDVSRENTKSYPEEIFEICGFKYLKEEYLLHPPSPPFFKGLKKKSFLIGLNTGCGNRWKTRLWPEANWIELAQKLARHDTEVILMGGPGEDERNERIAKASGSLYLGYFPIEKFISLVGECDLVVTGVTLALHIAIGLKKKIVLMNNIFNRNEFELYNLGLIIEPKTDCLGCYKSTCGQECMRLIQPDDVAKACQELLYGK